MGKKSRSGFGMNIPDHISESLETVFWVKILKFFYADAARNLFDHESNPGWKKFGSGVNTVSATLFFSVANPGSHAFLTPRSGMGKKSRPGSAMNIPDHISESLETIFG